MVDNSTAEIDIEVLFPDEHLLLIKNGGNLGLATALNRGVDKAIALGFEDIFLFDQDSRIPDNFITDMLEFKRDKADPSTVIIAPNFIDTNIGTEARFSVLKKWRWHNVSCSDGIAPLFVSFAITSGTLLDAKLHKKLGPFRDDYFIDHVDSEYCLRSISKGLKVRINCNVRLSHQIGERCIKRLVGLTIKPNNHNHIRRYYIFRNGARLSFEYGSRFPSIITLNIARMIHEILSVLFFEENKPHKMRSIGKGILHGITNKMGKYT